MKMNDLAEDTTVTGAIIGCAMRVHSALGPGFFESVYKNAFVHELLKNDLGVECERPIDVRYDGIIVGVFAADMLIEGRILLETKAVHCLVPAHEVQVVNYLAATGLEIGLLINFGAERLQFKRKTRIFHPRTG